MESKKFEAEVLTGETIRSSRWSAFISHLGALSMLEVSGDVVIGNPGIEVDLLKRPPSASVSPALLQLDLFLYQRPGLWPQLAYDKVLSYWSSDTNFTVVEIYYNNKVVEHLVVSTTK